MLLEWKWTRELNINASVWRTSSALKNYACMSFSNSLSAANIKVSPVIEERSDLTYPYGYRFWHICFGCHFSCGGICIYFVSWSNSKSKLDVFNSYEYSYNFLNVWISRSLNMYTTLLRGSVAKVGYKMTKPTWYMLICCWVG